MSRNNQKSKLDALTAEQREQLIFWLCIERLTYEKALVRIEEKFGVHSSSAALSKFWQRECEPYLMRQAKLKDAFLEIRVRVKQGETILGETEFSVALSNPAARLQQSCTSSAGITFDVENGPGK